MAELGLGKLCFSKNNGMLAYHKNLGNLIFKGAGGEGGGGEGGGGEGGGPIDQTIKIWLVSYPGDFKTTWWNRSDTIYDYSSSLGYELRQIKGSFSDIIFIPDSSSYSVSLFGNGDLGVEYKYANNNSKNINSYIWINVVKTPNEEFDYSYDVLAEKYFTKTTLTDNNYYKNYNETLTITPTDSKYGNNSLHTIEPYKDLFISGSHIEYSIPVLCLGNYSNQFEKFFKEGFVSCDNKDYTLKFEYNNKFYFSSIKCEDILNQISQTNNGTIYITFGVFFHNNNTITIKTAITDRAYKKIDKWAVGFWEDLPA